LGPNFDGALRTAFYMAKTAVERAFAASDPNHECCQAIAFMV
jgi:hypothetical protein